MDGATQEYAKDLGIRIILTGTAKTSILCLLINNKKNVTFMEYEKKYTAALERAAKLRVQNPFDTVGQMVEHIFPELKNSEDEKIRKELIDAIQGLWANDALPMPLSVKRKDSWIAWLEKQGEQKPIDYNEELKKCRENPLYFFDKYVSVKLKNQKPDWSEDDEKIKKEIIRVFKGEISFTSEKENEKYIAWLEKQGEQKPADKVKPKFKAKDWIVNGGANPCYVKFIFEDNYVLCSCEGFEYTKPIIDVNYTYHLWSITDARDGDVVVDKSDGTIGIFQSIGHHPDGGSCNDPSYCFLYCRYDDDFFYADFENGNTINSNDLIPATKEQRDLLFEEMTQAGWEWNSEKKELSKKTLKITPKFCIGQLITDDNGNWYKILNIECLDDWYYEVYDIAEDKTYLELCSNIDEKFRENRFTMEIKKMMGD